MSENINKYTNPLGFIATENNRLNIYNVLLNKSLDGQEIAKKVGISYSRVNVLLKYLIDNKHVVMEKVKIPNQKSRRFYSSTNVPYIKRNKFTAENGRYYKPNNYYGVGEFFNPWQPRIPEGKGKVIKLFEQKKDDYFKRTLKRTNIVNIGSSFSMFT